jgi:GxxExxY protein
VVLVGREKIVVELKAIGGQLGAPEEQQLRNYLRLLNASRGLLINFQQPGRRPVKTRLEIKEIRS